LPLILFRPSFCFSFPFLLPWLAAAAGEILVLWLWLTASPSFLSSFLHSFLQRYRKREHLLDRASFEDKSVGEVLKNQAAVRSLSNLCC